MSVKLYLTWQARIMRLFQWMLPLTLVVVDLAFNCNDYVGLVSWTFFILSLVLWFFHFTDLTVDVICMLEFLSSASAALCYGFTVLFSTWDFYIFIKYGSGIASLSAVYGVMCFASMYVNLYMSYSYLGVMFIQYVMSSPYGLRRKERRDAMFKPDYSLYRTVVEQ